MIHNVKMGLLNPYSLTHSLLILGGLIKYKNDQFHLFAKIYWHVSIADKSFIQ